MCQRCSTGARPLFSLRHNRLPSSGSLGNQGEGPGGDPRGGGVGFHSRTTHRLSGCAQFVAMQTGDTARLPPATVYGAMEPVQKGRTNSSWIEMELTLGQG